MNATVNTNLSAVTDPVGNRGNIPNGVMPLRLTDIDPSAPKAITFGATDATGNDPTIGSYQANLPPSGAANPGNGNSQLVTITFSKAHGWSAATHDLDIQLVGATDQDANTVVGMCSGGSFPTVAPDPASKTLTFMRQVGGITAGTPNLVACTALITVRKRGVTHVPA